MSREEWLAARRQHLAREKEFTHARDRLSAERRELPWVRVEKSYRFDGSDGPVTLGDLFAGRSQLIVYHFMFGPTGTRAARAAPTSPTISTGRPSTSPSATSRWSAVSRAPLAEIQAFRKRMGWHFNWVSSFASDFNRDFHVSFTPEELAGGEVYYNYTRSPFPVEEAPGASVFYRSEAGEIFHTYSAYARGLDILVGAYNFLDLVPKGRDEDGLAFTMEWVRHHDRYPV